MKIEMLEQKIKQIQPVSYTHLDVYKRQHPSVARFVPDLNRLQPQKITYYVINRRCAILRICPEVVQFMCKILVSRREHYAIRIVWPDWKISRVLTAAGR